MPEIMVIDDKSGVLRAVYPVLEIGSYNVTVSLGTDVLISRKIVSGKAKDRPKNLYHWSEEETIFAQEFSVAMQRAELVKQELERQAEEIARLSQSLAAAEERLAVVPPPPQAERRAAGHGGAKAATFGRGRTRRRRLVPSSGTGRASACPFGRRRTPA